MTLDAQNQTPADSGSNPADAGGAAPSAAPNPNPAPAAGGEPASAPAATPPAPAAGGEPAAFDWSKAVSNPELLQAEVMQGVDSPDALIERAIKLDGTLNAEGRVKIPGENATPEEIAEFRQAIGVPAEATAEAYGFKDPGFDPNSGVTFDQGMSDWAAQSFHKHGVPKNIAEGIFRDWNDKMVADVAAERERINEMGRSTEEALRRQHGEMHNQIMGEMRSVVREIAGERADKIEAMLSQPAIGNDPDVMGFLLDLRKFYAEAKGEEAFKRPSGGPGSVGLTPAEAKAQVDTLTKDRNGPYWNKDHPEHTATVQKVNRLYEAMNPTPGGE